jgi:hypothetical protein
MEETGTSAAAAIYTIFIVLLYLMPLFDFAALYMAFFKKQADKDDYVKYGISPLRTVLDLIIAAAVVFIAFAKDFSVGIKIAHIILALLICASEITKITVKVKFGKSK